MIEYGDYFQKSYHLLYPLLDIVKETPFVPETYLYWEQDDVIDEDKQDMENFHLLVYFKDKSMLFDIFSKGVLIKHSKLKSVWETTWGWIYLFDLIDYSWDVAHFLYGNYTKMSEESRKKILNFHGILKNGMISPSKYSEIALFPEKYYSTFAQKFECTEKELKRNVELVPSPEREKETFKEEGKEIWQCEEKLVFLSK